jgi:hypothetical protein
MQLLCNINLNQPKWEMCYVMGHIFIVLSYEFRVDGFLRYFTYGISRDSW